MLTDRPISVTAVQSIQLLSEFRKHQFIGQFSFSLLFIGHLQCQSSKLWNHPDWVTIYIVHSPEQTETGLITVSDLTIRAKNAEIAMLFFFFVNILDVEVSAECSLDDIL